MRIIMLLVFTVLAGCTSGKPLADQTFTQESLTEQLDKQYTITVYKKDGGIYRLLQIDAIEENYLLCHSNKYENLIIHYSSIKNIKIEYPDTVKTLIVFVAIPLVLILIAVNSFSLSGWNW